MYKAINKTKEIWNYMEELSHHNGAPALRWKDKTSCIYVAKSKIVPPRSKQFDITV